MNHDQSHALFSRAHDHGLKAPRQLKVERQGPGLKELRGPGHVWPADHGPYLTVRLC